MGDWKVVWGVGLSCLTSDWHPHKGICALLVYAVSCSAKSRNAVALCWAAGFALVLLQCDGCSSNFFSPHLELFPFCAEMQDICAQIQCCVCGGCLASSHLGVSGPHLPLPGKDHIGHHLLPAPNTREDLNKHIHPVVTPSYMVLTSHVGNAWD